MSSKIPEGSMSAFYQQTAGPAVQVAQQADPDSVIQIAQQHFQQTIPLRRVNAFSTAILREALTNIESRLE